MICRSLNPAVLRPRSRHRKTSMLYRVKRPVRQDGLFQQSSGPSPQHERLSHRRNRFCRRFGFRYCLPHSCPDICERPFDLRNGLSLDFHSRIPPWIYLLCAITNPRVSHAKSRNEADLSIDNQALAVVPREPSKRAVHASCIMMRSANRCFQNRRKHRIESSVRPAGVWSTAFRIDPCLYGARQRSRAGNEPLCDGSHAG